MNRTSLHTFLIVWLAIVSVAAALAASSPAWAAAMAEQDSVESQASASAVSEAGEGGGDGGAEGEPEPVEKRRGRGLVSIANPVAATGSTARWVSKRRQFTLNGIPYGFTGLPIVFFSPNTGWNYGLKAHWADYQRAPYRYKMTVYWVRSSEGRASSALRLKVPNISGTGFGVRLMGSIRKDIRARYYGLSNNSERDQELIDADENYYHYVLKLPRFLFSLLRHIHGPVSMSAGFGLESTDVDARGARSFFEEQPPAYTAVDGTTGFISLTLQYDTRDDPTIPKSGTFHEWSYETSRNSLLGLFFEEIDFRRYTFTDAHYYPYTERLNLAHRTVVEALKGLSVPLYAYGEIGGSRRIKGLGGSDSLRGFDSQRFTDNIRMFTNTEVRYRLDHMRAFRQDLEWHGALFLDAGQVAPGFAQLSAGEVHWTGGVGLRLYWNADFVIRMDVGFSSEQISSGVKYHNIF